MKDVKNLAAESFDAEYLRLIGRDITEAQAHLDELPLSERRGLALDTLRHFHCGYLRDWILTKCRAEYACGLYVNPETGEPKHLPPKSERIIIPTASLQHFNAVATPRARLAMEKRFVKQHAGTMELFCDNDALNSDLIVVVEGEIDAMSIWQATRGEVAVVAILGCSNANKTLGARLPELVGKRFVILLDADESGKKNANALCDKLFKARYPAVVRCLYDYLPPNLKKDPHSVKVDANEILVQHGDETLRSLMNRVLESASDELNFVADQIDRAKIEEGNVTANPSLILPDSEKPALPSSTCQSANSRDFDIWRAGQALTMIPVAELTYDEWCNVGMALKNNGNSCDEWAEWSRNDKRFKAGECERLWNNFNRGGFTIATVIDIAKRFGYDAKTKRKEWYDLHPDLQPSAQRIMDETTKSELDDAIAWLDTLAPENFTADDARASVNLRAVALAQTFGFNAQAENFFIVIKKAKEIARIRLKDVESDLIDPIPEAEKNALTALVEGINIKSLRNEVDREITEIKRAQNKFRAQQAKARAKAAAIKHAQEHEQTVEDNVQKLIELRAEYTKNPSPELAARIQNLILHTCENSIDKYTGAIKAVKATQRNANLIFTFDPYLDGLFGYDQFQQADVFLKPPIWSSDTQKGDEWKDRDDAQLQAYLRDIYTEFNSEKLILNSITVYSDAHKFHEVKDFFHSLPKWDGKKRAETLFVKFLKADDTPFTREVTLNILTAAVARIFHSGCDYQLAPILLGEQGIGKSYLLGKLFGKWYGSLVDDVSDPHAIDAIQKLWGVEIKEMAAMKKDIDANKRFIDSARDTRRQAYARRATTVPRHCVFVITTNNRMCLTDMTGNRRYPIIVCHNKPRQYVEGLTDKYVLQVWAEVFAYYNELFKDGFDERKLELSRDSQIQSDEIAEEYLRDDGMESEIRAYLETKIPPLVIWYLLSREERRKFFSDGGRIQLEQDDLEARFKNHAGKKYDAKLADFEKACEVKKGLVRHFTDRDGRWQFAFYGAELREHICAVEIYNECFGNDRRKSPTRINEILNRIDDWSLGARIQKADPAYLDQKKVFYRNTD